METTGAEGPSEGRRPRSPLARLVRGRRSHEGERLDSLQQQVRGLERQVAELWLAFSKLQATMRDSQGPGGGPEAPEVERPANRHGELEEVLAAIDRATQALEQADPQRTRAGRDPAPGENGPAGD